MDYTTDREPPHGAPTRAVAPRPRPNSHTPAPPRRLFKPLPRIVVAAATCLLLVSLTVWLIDRPFSTWAHQNLGDERFHWFTGYYEGHMLVVGPFSLMVTPAHVLGPLAIFILAGLALSAAAGWRPRTRGRIVLALTLSIIAAVEINTFAKAAFGRTWPESWMGDNPSWIRDGVFGFFPFHQGPGWGSFPSGHTTVITAPAAILWVVWPELRLLWAGIVAVVVIGLLGADYHFVSDIIGGLYLGVATGLAIAALMLSPGDRLSWAVLRKPARRPDLAAPAEPHPDPRPGPPAQP